MAITRSDPWRATYAERAQQIRREAGLSGLAARALHRVVSPVVDWGGITLFERRLDDVDPTEPALPTPGMQVREVAAAEADRLRDGIDPLQEPDEIARRFRRGDRGFAAIDADGRAAHVRWLTTTRALIPEIGRDIVLAPGQAYFYNGYTRPDRRGCGVDGLVRNAIFRTLRREGFDRAYSYVRLDNPAGFRAASRWQRAVATIGYLRLASLAPFVFGRPPGGTVALQKPGATDADRLGRQDAWTRWFRSWQTRPLDWRSTGCGALPAAYFESTAAFIASALKLDPAADSVLDLGCDSAMVSRLVIPHCRRFTGVDLTTELLADGRKQIPPGGTSPWLLAADGRRLPFRSGSFTRAYCTAVIHTLPTHEDGRRLIDELVRVTAPGGTILVSSVPDRARRVRARLEMWRRARGRERLTLPLGWLLPAPVRRAARRVLNSGSGGPPAFLEYDLAELSRTLRARGLFCEIRDFPDDYWSRDFRTSRSNLLIAVPAST